MQLQTWCASSDPPCGSSGFGPSMVQGHVPGRLCTLCLAADQPCLLAQSGMQLGRGLHTGLEIWCLEGVVVAFIALASRGVAVIAATT